MKINCDEKQNWQYSRLIYDTPGQLSKASNQQIQKYFSNNT